MKEIGIYIPSVIKNVEKTHQMYLKKLQPLFKNPNFQEQVRKIRDRFNIPPTGIDYSGVTNEITESGKKQNRKEFLNVMALVADESNKVYVHTLDGKLKPFLKVKSRRKQFQKEITKLRCNFGLPIRFQETLADFVIPYGKFPKIYVHSSRCLIRGYKDKGKKRLFIEIFGDTKRKHIKEAWITVRRAKKEHKIEMRSNLKIKNHYSIKLYFIEGIKRIMIEVFKNTEKKHIEAIKAIDIKKAIRKYRLPGGHLFRCESFYGGDFLDKSFVNGMSLVNAINKDMPLNESIEDQRWESWDRQKINLYRWRHKKYLEKYSS